MKRKSKLKKITFKSRLLPLQTIIYNVYMKITKIIKLKLLHYTNQLVLVERQCHSDGSLSAFDNSGTNFDTNPQLSISPHRVFQKKKAAEAQKS